MFANDRIAKTITVALLPPEGSGVDIFTTASRMGRSSTTTGSTTGFRRAALLVLIGILPTCLARFGAGTSIHSAEVVASSSVFVAAAAAADMPLDDLALDDILVDRQLGSKNSKSKSKSKGSKSKSKKKSKNKSSSSGKKDKKSSSDKKRKDSSKSDSSKKKKNKTPEMSDITKEVVSILKDRKNVVNGKDKTKALDQKDLRNKVLDELGVKDSDRGEAKKMFEDAIEKLEKKDEIVLDNDGDVK